MQHCTLELGCYTKDLSIVNEDLSSVFILDNSPGAYRYNPGKVFLDDDNVYVSRSFIFCLFFFGATGSSEKAGLKKFKAERGFEPRPQRCRCGALKESNWELFPQHRSLHKSS